MHHTIGQFNINIMMSFHRIQHLILVEPWGFIRKPKEKVSLYRRRLNVSNLLANFISLFTMVRFAGPYGK